MNGEVQKILMKVSPKDIGGRLRESRVAAHFSQSELSAQTGVSTGTISRLERGIYEPSISTLCLMAQALGVSLDYLIMGSSKDTSALINSPIAHKLCSRFLLFKPSEQRLLLAIATAISQNRPWR